MVLFLTLNESPSEKEGKLAVERTSHESPPPSMKVPPKRKGNDEQNRKRKRGGNPSMKVPPKRKGNGDSWRSQSVRKRSMKVPPKMNGNAAFATLPLGLTDSLNESPSEKEGKSRE